MRVGEQIRALSVERGLTVDDVARMLSSQRVTIEHVIEGRAHPPHPGLANGYKELAEALGLDVNDLCNRVMFERYGKKTRLIRKSTSDDR